MLPPSHSIPMSETLCMIYCSQRDAALHICSCNNGHLLECVDRLVVVVTDEVHASLWHKPGSVI